MEIGSKKLYYTTDLEAERRVHGELCMRHTLIIVGVIVIPLLIAYIGAMMDIGVFIMLVFA